MPGIKNQEANDLAQIASGYNVSKKKLEELIKVRDKAMPTSSSSSNLSNEKFVEAERLRIDPKNYDFFAIDYMSNSNWRKLIIEYLENPTGLTYQKIKYML